MRKEKLMLSKNYGLMEGKQVQLGLSLIFKIKNISDKCKYVLEHKLEYKRQVQFLAWMSKNKVVNKLTNF